MYFVDDELRHSVADFLVDFLRTLGNLEVDFGSDLLVVCREDDSEEPRVGELDTQNRAGIRSGPRCTF